MLVQLFVMDWLSGTIWTSFLLATCTAVPQCPNGTVEVEDATAIIDCINQARRKLADGLQTTVNGTLLPPAKDMYDMQWDCEIEEVLYKAIPNLCDVTDKGFYWFSFQEMGDEDLPKYITRELLSEIENEAPTNITKQGVYYNDSAYKYGGYGGYIYPSSDYLNLIRASTRKFACIKVSGQCNGFNPLYPLFYCGSDKPELQNGDIVYEIATATTSVSTATTRIATTAKITASVASTERATASVATTERATANVATTVTSPKLVATSSNPTSPKHITQCASAPTTPSCMTQSPKRVRREAKASLSENFIMKKPAPAKRGGKTHRKQLRNTPMTLTAHRTHAAKAATGEN